MSNRDENGGFFEVRLSLLSPSEGGREHPIRSGYMPNWWLPGTPEPVLASAAITLLETDELAPGSTATAQVYPFFMAAWGAVGVGSELRVTEGPSRTIGKAFVTRIVPSAVPAGHA